MTIKFNPIEKFIYDEMIKCGFDHDVIIHEIHNFNMNPPLVIKNTIERLEKLNDNI